MKTIVCFSDSHDMPLPQYLQNVVDESDYVFFLGDGLMALRHLVLKDNFYFVKGNMDSIDCQTETVVNVEGVKFLLCHGNIENVKIDLLNLKLKAESLGVNCALYGHTHIKDTTIVDGINYINPGSATRPRDGTPSYAYIVVDGGKYFVKLVNIG